MTTYLGVRRLEEDFDLALRAMRGGDAADRPRIIVTATDLGEGLVIRCPHCNTVHTLEVECSVCKETHRLEDWRGKERTCTNPKCGGPLRVNEFVVGGTGPRTEPAARVAEEPETTAEPAARVAEEPEARAVPVVPEVEVPAPELPIAGGAAQMLRDGAPDGPPGVNHWLLALLRRHGAMAENLVPGLRAPELARELADRLGAGQPGTPLSRDELVARAARRAQSRGMDRIAERDLAAAILSAAGYGAPEE